MRRKGQAMSLVALIVGLLPVVLLQSCQPTKGPDFHPIEQHPSPTSITTYRNSFQMWLTHQSVYDKQTTSYLVQAPTAPHPAAPLIVILDDPHVLEGVIPQQFPGWIVVIPSRPGMNYQLLAEGDFWNILKELTNKHPDLADAPTYLIGSRHAADAALLLASNYRYRFQGVAISEGGAGLDLSNLDALPVLYFNAKPPPSSTPSPLPWEGLHFIQRLQERGNQKARSIDGSLTEAIFTLVQQPSPEVSFVSALPLYTFSDEQYCRAAPWARIISRENPWAPATISATIVNSALTIHTVNVSGLELSRLDMPKLLVDAKKTYWNDLQVTFGSNSQKVVLSHESPPPGWPKKSSAAGGFLNFFRNEPLYIIYQDSGATEEYLVEAKTLASRLATLNFTAFPALQVNLPMLPLSLYKSTPPTQKHRIIAIGKPETLQPLVQVKPGYLPSVKEEAATASTAYGLIYPPEKTGPCVLALQLVAGDAEGLKILSAAYTSGTALYNPHDLRLWSAEQQGYLLQREEIFDSFWGSSPMPPLLLQTPSLTTNAWEKYLQQLVLNETSLSAAILPSLVDTSINVPTRIDVTTFSFFIPNRNLAIVTLEGALGAALGDALLDATEGPALIGLESLTYYDEESGGRYFNEEKMASKGKLQFIVDAQCLTGLSQEQLSQLSYTIAPFSLQEMIQNKLATQPQNVGRALLRNSSTEG